MVATQEKPQAEAPDQSNDCADLIARLNSFVATVTVGEPITKYHGDKSRISCSSFKDFLHGSDYYHARHVDKTLPAPYSNSLTHGTLLHHWFETADDDLSFAISPPSSMLTSTGAIGKKAKDWARENCPDCMIVGPKEKDQLAWEVKNLLQNRAFCEWREQIVLAEASIRFEGPEGIQMRTRFDAATILRWLDLKTTKETDILGGGFAKSVRTFGYDIQDAWYQMAMEACGLDPQPLVFIVVSTVPPHRTQCLTLPQDAVRKAKDVVLRGLADLRLRRELDWWLPDTTNETVEMNYPDFYRR